MNNFIDHVLESRPTLRTLIPHEVRELRFYSRSSWWPSAATDSVIANEQEYVPVTMSLPIPRANRRRLRGVGWGGIRNGREAEVERDSGSSTGGQ